jgi:hypothetical protein
MKAMINLLLLTLITVVGTHAQGTIQFGVKLTAVPPFESTPAAEYTGNGLFTLSGSVLNGTLTYTPLNQQSFTRIENSAGLPLFLPTEDVSLAPENANLATWTNVQLTDTQMSDLFRGDWWLNVGSIDYPQGALRGQLTAVPEPNTYVFFACGVLVVANCARRSRKHAA